MIYGIPAVLRTAPGHRLRNESQQPGINLDRLRRRVT